jgi:hypothetical protein
VRWFGEGSIPGIVRTWFDQCQGEIIGHQIRTDTYLGHLASDVLGIKIREGRLEIKHRTHHFGPIQLHRRVHGLAEQWRKWGLILEPDQFNSSFTKFSYPHWIRVKKDRQLRRYQLTLNGLLSQSAPVSGAADEVATNQVRGCDVELTSIQVENQKWWSLAFEAFGQVDSAYEDLLFVIGRLTESNEPPRFTAANSFGYPYWLAHL